MTWLIDTGPFVAYVARTDSAHPRVAASLEAFTGQLATTSAVVTEVTYFLSDIDGGPIAFAELLSASDTRIAESTNPAQILVAAQLMDKYSDTPMDFADATLVLLAEELAVSEILTLDHRGFSTYRTANGKSFRLVLS
jgi:predicted nucleic acid-binding protein